MLPWRYLGNNFTLSLNSLICLWVAVLQSSAPGPPRDPIEQRLEDVPEMTFAAVVSQLMADRVKTAPVVRTDEELEDMELYKTGHIDPPVFDAMFERYDNYYTHGVLILTSLLFLVRIALLLIVTRSMMIVMCR